MSWKSTPASADRLRAKLDDEFETVAKPQGLRRTSDARREKEAEAAEDAAAEGKPERKGPSLKMRAVGYLSRREHAREELARKLAAYADDADEVEAVLDALEKEGWLSTERFAQSLVHRRASRQGTARIVQELRQHGVDDNQVAELRDQLRATEYDRALEVWKKRFDAKPADRAAYAKQARFLASRGFAHDVIRRILGDSDED
ncbi:recombination regulator RecX [Achromobacter sp. NPDC008082]|uniref:recombination regulator RecX n=1 Tax=Achromobacter sp. NPDC008082 TaxID=3363888 RepID=UPI0036E978B1